MDDSTEFKLLPAVTIKRKKDSFDIYKFENHYNIKPDSPDNFQKLADLLAEGFTKSALEEKLDDDLDNIFDWMEKKRLIAKSGDAETRDDQIIASQSGYENLDDVKNLIRDSEVGLIGLESIGGLFNEKKMKIEEIRDSDVDVIVASSDNLNSLETINKEAIESDIPILHTWTQNNSLHIGPFVIPRTTACGKCLTSRINYDPGQVVAVECRIFEPKAFNPLLKQDLYRFLGRYQYPRTRDGVLEVDLTTFDIEKHSVFKVPNCDHCGEKEISRE